MRAGPDPRHERHRRKSDCRSRPHEFCHDWNEVDHEQHQHHRPGEHGPRHRRPGGRRRQRRRGHQPRRGQGQEAGRNPRSGTTAGTFGTAPAGDIVILALPHDKAAPVVAQYGDLLAGKIIIDITNAFNSDATGLTTGFTTSIAQEIAKVAPAGAHVVKAFNTVFGHVLAQGGPLDVLVAGDDAQAKATVAAFIKSLGLRPLDTGSLEMARSLEGAGLLMMGLGRHGAGNFNFTLGVNTSA